MVLPANLRYVIRYFFTEHGSIEKIEEQNIKKANVLYEEIDRNSLFYGTADVKHRMNVTFQIYDVSLKHEFLDFAAKNGIVGLKGYRTAGGFGASLYNALPLSSVEFLVYVMKRL